MRLGRITGLNEPWKWDSGGDRINVLGSYRATSLADGLQRRDQILGYSDNVDEPAIPVVTDGETRINGFYYASNARILTDDFVRSAGNFEYTIDLVPVFGFSAPMFESIWTAGLYTNDNTVSLAPGGAAYPLAAIPSSADEYITDFTVNHLQAPENADDVNGMFSMSDRASAIHATGSLRYSITPDRYYWAAPKLLAGAALQPIIGRRIAKPDWGNWELSNGIVRITPSATPINVNMAYYLGGAWSAAKEFQLNLSATTGRLTNISSFNILRNDPIAVILRWGVFIPGLTPSFQVFLDLILRRGAAGVDLVFWAPTAAGSFQYGVRRTVAEAATSITGGIRATTADANGGVYILGSERTRTQDLVQGGIFCTSFLQRCGFHLGWGTNGGPHAADGANWVIARDQERLNQYHCQVSETQRIVAR